MLADTEKEGGLLGSHASRNAVDSAVRRSKTHQLVAQRVTQGTPKWPIVYCGFRGKISQNSLRQPGQSYAKRCLSHCPKLCYSTKFLSQTIVELRPRKKRCKRNTYRPVKPQELSIHG